MQVGGRSDQMAAAAWRLATGEPDLSDAELEHRDRDQAGDRAVGEQRRAGQPLQTFGGRA
jgi:hypothetical protein